MLVPDGLKARKEESLQCRSTESSLIGQPQLAGTAGLPRKKRKVIGIRKSKMKIVRFGSGAVLAAVLGIGSFVPTLPPPAPISIDDTIVASGEYIHVDYAKKKLLCEPKKDASSHALIELWQLPKEGLTYKVNTASIPADLDASQTVGAIAAAAATWTSAGARPITAAGTVTSAGDINDETNTVSFGIIPRPDAVGMAIMRVSNGVVVEADIVLDATSPWAVNPINATGCTGIEGKFDVQNLMTHELGHWVGAKHPRDNDERDGNNGNKWRTMYSDIAPGELHKRTLTAGDIASIPSGTPSSFSGTVTRAGDDDG